MGQEFWSVVLRLVLALPDLLPPLMPDRLVLAVGERPQFLSLWTSLFTCPPGSLQNEQRKRATRSVSALYDVASEVNTITSLCILLVTQISRDSVWEGIIQRHKYQKAGIAGGPFGDWLPYLVSKNPFLGTVRGNLGRPGPGPVTL